MHLFGIYCVPSTQRASPPGSEIRRFRLIDLGTRYTLISKMNGRVFMLALALCATIAGQARADEDAQKLVSADAPPAEQSLTAQDVAFNLNGKAAYLSPPIRGGTTPFDMGYGGAFGVTISGVYIAASFMYFLGGTDVTLSDHSMFYGLEAGYAFKLARLGRGHLVLRPQLGAGGVSVYHTAPSTARVAVVSTARGSRSSKSSDTTSVSAVHVAPQIGLMYADERFLLGGAGTTMILPSIAYAGGAAATWVSYGGEAIAGVRF